HIVRFDQGFLEFDAGAGCQPFGLVELVGADGAVADEDVDEVATRFSHGNKLRIGGRISGTLGPAGKRGGLPRSGRGRAGWRRTSLGPDAMQTTGDGWCQRTPFDAPYASRKWADFTPGQTLPAVPPIQSYDHRTERH